MHGDFLIVARTNARAVHGLDDALERAHAYAEAGADVTFVEAPTSVDELQRIARERPELVWRARAQKGSDARPWAAEPVASV